MSEGDPLRVCPACGERDLCVEGSDAERGNISTGAADCEVTHRYVCGNCGEKFWGSGSRTLHTADGRGFYSWNYGKGKWGRMNNFLSSKKK